jgi:hypothetical protein
MSMTMHHEGQASPTDVMSVASVYVPRYSSVLSESRELSFSWVRLAEVNPSSLAFLPQPRTPQGACQRPKWAEVSRVLLV